MSAFSDDDDARERLNLALRDQKLFGNNQALIDQVVKCVQVITLKHGDYLINEGEDGNDLYLVISGAFDVTVSGRIVSARSPGDHVGMMEAIQPAQSRSASVIAKEHSVVGKLTASDLRKIGTAFPELYLRYARELSLRVHNRNKDYGTVPSDVKVFIVSSSEALPVARSVASILMGDNDCFANVWENGVYRLSSYTLKDLEEKLARVDYVIAIAQGDDIKESRGGRWPAPRDNVILELGMAIGKLGLNRAILMEPDGDHINLPNDFDGMMKARYRFHPGDDEEAYLQPAINSIRKHIKKNGPWPFRQR